MVNYVLETTGQTELFYAGHSQGTVMGFAGFTVNQTLAKQIKAFFALAPVTTVKHIAGLFAFISEYYVYHIMEVSSTHTPTHTHTHTYTHSHTCSGCLTTSALESSSPAMMLSSSLARTSALQSSRLLMDCVRTCSSSSVGLTEVISTL